ncbi:hypothetical protein [Streptomyces sp. 3214.6]|uniref:hypothetical protein n=1 Tax=Streptomyces sp. 3214.6 TaxID=1882757 RepID=UPI00090B92E0|nr:hypothetical protein [Streptomyces sp. 3214.6]SHI02569.1 hypothetical protein SAMN05444521_3331 [Streptomyces sp. 3214.6]
MSTMTRTDGAPRGGGPGARVVAGVGALLAALVLALLPVPPGATPAAAADGAAADSAVTVTGTRGKYDDFSGLKVTVHQTKNLRTQGVLITWKGGAPTPESTVDSNFLQIMQCWGDSPAGPTRESCEYGGSGVPLPGTGVDSRSVSATPDPEETQYTGAGAFVPFRPANGSPATTSPTDKTYFGPLDTNEQPAGRTFAGGTGEATFQVLDGIEASHLGCGLNTAAAGSAPAPRSCWLVIVPRGTHNPDGTDVTAPGQDGKIDGSPLTTTNWAQRMAVRLDFLPVDEFCPQGQPEQPTAGSQLATDAVTSWQPKLCTSTGTTFAFSQGGEEPARTQVLAATGDAPMLGFTVDPVAGADGVAKVVHAPVAVSGLAIAFFLETASGVVQEMRLSPRIVAKMLTHSYAKDVTLGAAPDYLTGNPAFFNEDPEFRKLNPEFPALSGRPSSLMVPLLTSDTTRIVWNWLQSDLEARAFLSGTMDPWGMKVNRYYKDLKLADATSLTDFPKVDPTTSPAVANGVPPLTYTGQDLDPYANDLHEAAVRTLRGNNNGTVVWQAGNNAPPKLGNEVPMSGRHAVLAIVDTASAERYGLKTAALRNADGAFVKPSTATLTAAVAAMRPSSVDATVLKPDPGRAKGQAYPLTAVAYAAASVDQAAAARKAYAKFIRYVAGAGQTPGLSAGQLPPGYAPLPAKQRTQARTAAGALERGVATGPASGGTGPDGTGGSGAAAGAGGTSAGTAAGGTSAGAAGGPGGSATPVAGAAGGTAGPSSGPQQNVAKSANGVTPGEILGIIRWVLLVVLFLGGAAGLSGPIMLRLAQRRSP